MFLRLNHGRLCRETFSGCAELLDSCFSCGGCQHKPLKPVISKGRFDCGGHTSGSHPADKLGIYRDV